MPNKIIVDGVAPGHGGKNDKHTADDGGGVGDQLRKMVKFGSFGGLLFSLFGTGLMWAGADSFNCPAIIWKGSMMMNLVLFVGTFVAHAATHDFVAAKSMSAPDLTGNVVDVAVKRDLHLEYVDADGNPLQHDPIQAHAWDGQKHDSTLDDAVKSILSNVSRGSFRADQIKRK